ncbi:hypothetical protein KR093_002296 [Drosophila rubida]|uniref:BTB domain-containing protein n=1 Tax=Drosophila rubida TaxID=30044 RepID=A0AAD4KGA4_9MUSC|nr:hypothetical protein KR093_002296 [Drosophila rubida]
MGYEFDPTVVCNLFYEPERLEQNIMSMVRRRTHTDLKVNVHGHYFNCHRTVLQLSTEYFRHVTVFECVYITSERVTPLGFELAYQWMTTMEAVPQREYIVDLYMTARFLVMPELENLLWHDFENRALFNEGHAFQLYLETLPFGESTLQQLMLTRVSHFFLTAIATEEFLRLSVRQVYALLSSNVAGINSELEILMCIIRWIYSAWRERRQHLRQLISAVRFHLMPPWCLVSLKATQTDAKMRDICAEPCVQQRLNEGLSYSVAHQVLTEQESLQERGEMQGGSDREWIIDEQAAHHHVYQCVNWKPLDSALFSSYMDRVINAGPLFYTTLKAKSFDNLMPCCQAKLLADKQTLNTD